MWRTVVSELKNSGVRTKEQWCQKKSDISSSQWVRKKDASQKRVHHRESGVWHHCTMGKLPHKCSGPQSLGKTDATKQANQSPVLHSVASVHWGKQQKREQQLRALCCILLSECMWEQHRKGDLQSPFSTVVVAPELPTAHTKFLKKHFLLQLGALHCILLSHFKWEQHRKGDLQSPFSPIVVTQESSWMSVAFCCWIQRMEIGRLGDLIQRKEYVDCLIVVWEMWCFLLLRKWLENVGFWKLGETWMIL